MKASCRRLQAGEIDFDGFARETAARWQSLARMLIRRWRPPATVTEEDVVQELLLGAWRYRPKFDPARGVALERFLIWNACTEAKRFLHRQRQAHKRSDKSESRNAVPLSQLLRPDEDESRMLEGILGAGSGEGAIEAGVECRSRLENLGAEERVVLLARVVPPRRRRRKKTSVERRLEQIRKRCGSRRRRTP